ncbi:MAG: hypothetical protein M1586_00920 [Patescibacteria group bacterium]|nr:hypothetical protein [Patescibacteria group bacterium]MCL5261848.1 hypothetical protein [Patescibacteria group bacterium]
MDKLITAQLVVLIVGTMFAWGNFIKELVAWRSKKVCVEGCAPGINPLKTPCFYGAIVFSAALVLHVLIMQG